MKYLKLKLAKFFRKSSFSKLSIREWHLRDFSSFEKKILTLQHFCDITPKNTDIIECGVGAGGGANLLSRISYSLNKRYFAFDTFSGFPDGSKQDNFFKSENRAVFECFTVEYIKDQLKKSFVPGEVINSINFRKGFFKDTFSDYQGIPGFVFIDVDLYESYKDCLEFFYPLLPKNGVIMVDEYDSKKDLKKWPGAKIAIDEFCNIHKVELKKHWTGYNYFQK